MITLISKWFLLNGCPPELQAELQELVLKSQAEDGNISYSANLSSLNPLNSNGKPLDPPAAQIPLSKQDKIVFIETYVNVNALSLHLAGEPFLNFLKSNIQYFRPDPANANLPKTETEFYIPVLSSSTYKN